MTKCLWACDYTCMDTKTINSNSQTIIPISSTSQEFDTFNNIHTGDGINTVNFYGKTYQFH